MNNGVYAPLVRWQETSDFARARAAAQPLSRKVLAFGLLGLLQCGFVMYWFFSGDGDDLSRVIWPGISAFVAMAVPAWVLTRRQPREVLFWRDHLLVRQRQWPGGFGHWIDGLDREVIYWASVTGATFEPVILGGQTHRTLTLHRRDDDPVQINLSPQVGDARLAWALAEVGVTA